MWWKNMKSSVWISVFKITCGTKTSKKFNSISAPKRTLKSNLFIKPFMKLNCSALDIWSPDKISLFCIQLGWARMIWKIQEIWRKKKSRLSKRALKIIITCSFVSSIKTRANFHHICSSLKDSVNCLILNIVS